MQEASVDSKKRSIRSETTKAFFSVFCLLALLGLTMSLASYRGSRTIDQLNDVYLKQFQAANLLQAKSFEIIASFYLLSGNNDLELQMQRMMEYEGQVKEIDSARSQLVELVTKGREGSSKDVLLGAIDELAKQLEALKLSAQQMMLASMEGRKEDSQKSFGELHAQIPLFKASLEKIRSEVQARLDSEVAQTRSTMKLTTLVSVVLTGIAVLLTLFLIYRLMQFLSVSLLPISTLMDNLPEAVFSIDAKGVVLSPASAYSQKVFEKPIEALHIDDVLFPDSSQTKERIGKIVEDVFQKPEAFSRESLKNLPQIVKRANRDGSERYLRMIYTPLLDQAGILKNLMLVAEDVTEVEVLRQREREFELTRLAHEMEQKQKAAELELQKENLRIAHEKNEILASLRLEVESKFSLASEVAHRLNNPMNYIQLGIEGIRTIKAELQHQIFAMLGDTADDPELAVLHETDKQLFQELERSTDVLQLGLRKSTDYIQEIRGLSGVDGYSFEKLIMVELVERAKERLSEFCSREDFARVTVQFEPDEKIIFSGNRYLLKSAFELFVKFCLQNSKGHLLVKVIVEPVKNHLLFEPQGQLQAAEHEWTALANNLQRVLRASYTHAERVVRNGSSAIQLSILEHAK